jgi:predicted branched-subunit amino acid permease
MSPGFRTGVREAFGVPAAVLGAGFVGYGSLAQDAGYSVWLTLTASVAIWALPGQLVLLEMQGSDAALFATLLAVSLSAARFLPMTLTLTPLLRQTQPRPSVPRLLFAAQLISMTTWAVSMRRFNDLEVEQRWSYFMGFSAVCIGVAAVCALVGQLLIGALPPLARYGLALLTPLYFFVTLVGEARDRFAFAALVCGAVFALGFQLWMPDWSLLAAGFIGGTIAWWIQRHAVRR